MTTETKSNRRKTVFELTEESKQKSTEYFFSESGVEYVRVDGVVYRVPDNLIPLNDDEVDAWGGVPVMGIDVNALACEYAEASHSRTHDYRAV